MKIIKVISVAIVILTCFQECNFESNKQNKEVVKLGSILALTGEASSYGDMMKKGMNIALQEINSDSTNKFTYRIIFEDSRSTPSGAINAAKKLIEIDKVDMITCITASKNALSVCPIANENKIIIVDALSSAAKLTEAGGKSFFRIMPSDNYSGSYIANWATADGKKRAGIFYANDDWGNGIQNVSKKVFENSGGETYSEAINLNQNNFRDVLYKMKSFNPDVIFLLTYAPEAGIIVKQSKELGINVEYVGSDNLSAGEFAKDRSEIVEGVKFCLPSPGEGILYERLNKKYSSLYNENISVNSIKSYDVVHLAAYAMENCSHEYDSLYQFLINLKSYKGASGLIEFDNNGDIKFQNYQRMVYKNGKYSIIKN